MMIEIEKILAIQKAWQAIAADDHKACARMALESLTGCAEAVAVLGSNLKELGYSWCVSEKLSPDLIDKNTLSIKEKTGISISPLLVMFWKIVGGVSFVDLEHYRHIDFWKANGVISTGIFSDGLHIYVCNNEWADFACEDYFDWKEDSAVDENGFLLALSPDYYHKDNFSGGAPYGIYPDLSWKPIWQNFSWPTTKPITALTDTPDFLSYLRTSILECAGFPGFSGLPKFNPTRERLLKGVPLF